jgi:hypothetical protein
MNNLTDLLCGNNFQDIGDFKLNHHDNLELDSNISKTSGIIFCKTDYLTELFSILRNSDKKYVLITHMSDYAITKNIFDTKPTCIKRWFAQNPEFINDILTSIPIGIENYKGKHKSEFAIPQYLIDYEYKLKNKPKILDAVYCNWNVNNNLVERSGVVNKLKCMYVQERGREWLDYIDNMSNFKFIISPPGNGIDCVRTWEALYCGCVPIVKRHPIYDLFKGLPIIQVDDYSEVNQDMLLSFDYKKYNLKMLNMEYWKTLITNSYINIKS